MKNGNRSFKSAVLAAALLAGMSSIAVASNVATQSVSFEVQAINELSVSGSPSLVIQAATAGSAPTAVTANAAYAITTNETNRKITASIDSDMPTGTTLTVSLASPGSGSSAGIKTLSTTATDVVSGISTINSGGNAITYGLSATSAAGVVPADTRTVTFTVTAGS